MLDSRQAVSLSADGSKATFNLNGGVSTSYENQTGLLCLKEFTAGHTIYNIDITNNVLDYYVQYLDPTNYSKNHE